MASGTPSPSESPLAGAVVDVVVDELDVVVGRVVVGRVVVVVAVVTVVVGRLVVVDEVVVDGRVVVVVEVVDVVVEAWTVPRHDAPATLCAIRVLTVLPKRRSMFESPPLSSWQ